MRDILGESLFMDRCSVSIGQVRDANAKCRSCSYVDKCNGGCRAIAVCSSSDYLAVDPSNCNFFQGGWYEKFKEASEVGREAYLERHPEIVEAIKANATSKEAHEEASPFSNC